MPGILTIFEQIIDGQEFFIENGRITNEQVEQLQNLYEYILGFYIYDVKERIENDSLMCDLRVRNFFCDDIRYNHIRYKTGDDCRNCTDNSSVKSLSEDILRNAYSKFCGFRNEIMPISKEHNDIFDFLSNEGSLNSDVIHLIKKEVLTQSCVIPKYINVPCWVLNCFFKKNTCGMCRNNLLCRNNPWYYILYNGSKITYWDIPKELEQFLNDRDLRQKKRQKKKMVYSITCGAIGVVLLCMIGNRDISL